MALLANETLTSRRFSHCRLSTVLRPRFQDSGSALLPINVSSESLILV